MGVQKDKTQSDLTTEMLRLAVKISGVGIFEWWPDTNLTRQDHTIEEIFGYARGEMPEAASAYTPHYFPEDLASIAVGVADAVANVTLFTYEHRIIRTTGEIRWIKCWVQPVREPDSRVRVIGTMLDVTDQRANLEGEKLLSSISEVLASSFAFTENVKRAVAMIVENLCDCAYIERFDVDVTSTERVIAVKDPETRKIRTDLVHLRIDPSERENPFIENITSGEVIPLPDYEAFRRKIAEIYNEEYAKSVTVDGMKSGLICVLRAKGQSIGAIILCLRKGSPVNFGKHEARLLKEISYRFTLALENAQLYQSSLDAIRARDEFLSVASHELKTPLQSLTLQNGMLSRKIEKHPDDRRNIDEVRKFLESDRRQLMRISRLIEDMLDITRIQSAQMRIEIETFDFVSLLRDTLDRLRPAFELEKMPFTLTGESSLVIEADSFRIEQVITNLLSNALKYGNHKPVEIHVEKKGDQFRFLVKDHGRGISKADQQKIFRRFERLRARNEIGGLGLGLYICQKIAESHGGAVSLESEEGKGSTFILTLPIKHPVSH